MKTATIRLTWTKSVSLDVESQNLKILINGEQFTDVELPATAEEYIFDADEKSLVNVSIRTYDGTFFSDYSTELNFYVPDLSAPQPPTNLAYSIIGTSEKPPEYT